MNDDKALTGIILIGGNSSRMGTPKFLLEYHQKSQLPHSVDLLKNFFTNIHISCNKSQVDNIPVSLKVIIDNERYEDAGPMTGILSSLDKVETSIFVLGCDYPFITEAEIDRLLKARNHAAFATVFSNFTDNQPEPLLGVYEYSCKAKLQDLYSQNKRSLRRFLDENFVSTIRISNVDALKSVDTIDEYHAVRNLLK